MKALLALLIIIWVAGVPVSLWLGWDFRHSRLFWIGVAILWPIFGGFLLWNRLKEGGAVKLLQRDQARSKHLCPYSNKGFGGRRLNDSWRAIEVTKKDLGQKRVRVKCPVCGRRMWGWAIISHDAEILGYAIPLHKIKGWWRKRKKVSREQRTTQKRSVRKRS